MLLFPLLKKFSDVSSRLFFAVASFQFCRLIPSCRFFRSLSLISFYVDRVSFLSFVSFSVTCFLLSHFFPFLSLVSFDLACFLVCCLFPFLWLVSFSAACFLSVACFLFCGLFPFLSPLLFCHFFLF